MAVMTGFWGSPESKLVAAMVEVINPSAVPDCVVHTFSSATLVGRRRASPDGMHVSTPLRNDNGEVAVVFDGELYNSDELHSGLIGRGHALRTDSYEELVLHCYEEYGTQCFSHLNGIWALGLVDLRGDEPRLVLSRDHFGVKPLYLVTSGPRLLFGSSIKPILQNPSFPLDPNEQRIHEYLHGETGSDPDGTFFAGIRQLPPAHYAVIEDSGTVEHRYWSPQPAGTGRSEPDELRRRLEQAVDRRLTPGLSTGVRATRGPGSDTVARMMDGLPSGAVAGPQGAGGMDGRLGRFSALPESASTARHHDPGRAVTVERMQEHIVQPGSERFMAELPELLWHQEEPLSSVDAYLQWCVLRMASTEVDVLIDGLGAAEVMTLGRTDPRPAPGFGARQRHQDPRAAWRGGHKRRARRAYRFVQQSAAQRGPQRQAPDPLIADLTGHGAEVQGAGRAGDRAGLLRSLRHGALAGQLADLAKISMACALPCRSPFLDPELVDWILGLSEPVVPCGGWCEGDEWADSARRLAGGRDADLSTLQSDWLKARRAQIQGVFRSPSFCERSYWYGLTISHAFGNECGRPGDLSPVFWRALNVELWLRIFIDRPREQRRRPPVPGELESVGDRECRSPALVDGTREPHPGHHLAMVGGDGACYLRLPTRTRNVWPSDSLASVLDDGLADMGLEFFPGDVVVVAEKIVAISQGRCVAVDQVKVGLVAKILSLFVTRTPAGISLRLPAAFQVAIQDVGLTRILAATAAAALTRPLGIRGAFYRVAGWKVAAIDSPDADALPPSDTHIKLAPLAPQATAKRLADHLSARAATRIEVAIVDVNDIGAEVLGGSAGVDHQLVVSVLRDNPLGQDTQQTPIGIIRRVAVAAGDAR